MTTYTDAGGDLTLELDEAEGLLRLKAVATFDDPVDLTPEAARELEQQLLRMAEAL